MIEGPKRISRQPRHSHSKHPHSKPAHPHKKVKHAKKDKTETVPVGFLVMMVTGSIFVAYAFNTGGVKDSIDAYFARIVAGAHKHDATVSSGFMTMLPFLAMFAGLIVIYLVLKLMGMGADKTKRVREVTEAVSVHQFAEIARGYGAGPMVAREMYRMLHRDHGNRLRSLVTQSWTAEMGVPADSLESVFAELVERSGGSIRGKVDVAALETPATMMQAAEACLERAAVELRAAMRAVSLPMGDKGRAIVPVPR